MLVFPDKSALDLSDDIVAPVLASKRVKHPPPPPGVSANEGLFVVTATAYFILRELNHVIRAGVACQVGKQLHSLGELHYFSKESTVTAPVHCTTKHYHIFLWKEMHV